MKPHRIFFALLIYFVASCFINTELFAQVKWSKIQSKNFQLIGDADEQSISEVAIKLEQFREAFRRELTGVNFKVAPPINVIVLKDEKLFEELKPVNGDGKRIDWAKGYFQSSDAANYIVILSKGDKAETYRTIFHEYAHYLVNYNIGRDKVPPWFNEGLAEYYEITQIDDNQNLTLGSLNESHLRLLQKNNLIPLEKFFNVDYYSLLREEKTGAGLFYAQAWALMHYLTHGKIGEQNFNLKKFVDLLLNSKPANEALREAFQTDLANLERELKTYIEQKSLKTAVKPNIIKLPQDLQIQTQPFTETEAKATLGEMLYHQNRFSESAALLEENLKTNPNSSQSYITLGLVKMKQKNFPDAQKNLEKAIKLNENNFLPYFQMAYIMSREGMSDFGFVSEYSFDKAEKMRKLLRKAIELNPNYAESYHLFAVVSVVRNEEIDQAIEYLEKALSIMPGNQWYQIRHAELLMRKEDFAKARKTAERIFLSAADDYMRLYAKNALENINSLEAQLEEIKKDKNRPRNEIEQPDRILTDAEIAELNRIGTLKSITATLRKPKLEERRVLGFLTRIGCESGAVEYKIKTDNRTLTLNSENFESLVLVSFNAGMANAYVGCDSVKKEIPAVIIYRPNANVRAKSDGDIVSIEFVPENFEFTY